MRLLYLLLVIALLGTLTMGEYSDGLGCYWYKGYGKFIEVQYCQNTMYVSFRTEAGKNGAACIYEQFKNLRNLVVGQG